MAYLKSNSTTNIWGRLKYVFDESAHDGSSDRVVAASGKHVNLFKINDHITSQQSGYYLNKQFNNIRKLAWNRNKKQQGQHLIISFDESEFNTDNNDNLSIHAKQANNLVSGFMDQYFGDTQWVNAIQCDGNGHKLHAHVLINTIKPDGKCVQTRRFSVSPLRKKFNKYMNNQYMIETGHIYLNPFDGNKSKDYVNNKGWKKQLEQTLEWAKHATENIREYLLLLKTKQVTVSQRNSKGDWSYHTKVKGKNKTVRDFYQRIDKKTGAVKSTRGIGIAYTPIHLNNYFKNKKIKNKENDIYEKESKRKSTKLERFARRTEQRRQSRLFQINSRKREDERYERKQQSKRDKKRSSKSGTRHNPKNSGPEL